VGGAQREGEGEAGSLLLLLFLLRCQLQVFGLVVLEGNALVLECVPCALNRGVVCDPRPHLVILGPQASAGREELHTEEKRG